MQETAQGPHTTSARTKVGLPFSFLIMGGWEPASEHAGLTQFQTFEKELSQLGG